MRDDMTVIAASPFQARASGAPKGRRIGRAGRTACLCAGLLASFWAASAAADALDTSRLPHIAGAKEIYASAPTTIYAVPDSVASTAQATDQALAGEGWRKYLPPNATQDNNSDQQILTFKKGSQAFTALITTPPGGLKTANLNYVALILANDLPFPVDAADIAYSPDTPYLSCVSAQPVAALRNFFSNELGALGWTLAPIVQSATSAAADDKAAHAFFVRPDHPPLLLLLQRGDDGKTKVELKKVSPEQLVAESQPAKTTPTALAAGAKVAAASATVVMAPKPGQVKMMFGNVMGADAVFTINKQTIKVAAGAGAKGADGPTIDLPPGKYRVVVKVAG
jgi:hypothetical protein